jgi:hypothetical protein
VSRPRDAELHPTVSLLVLFDGIQPAERMAKEGTELLKRRPDKKGGASHEQQSRAGIQDLNCVQAG